MQEKGEIEKAQGTREVHTIDTNTELDQRVIKKIFQRVGVNRGEIVEGQKKPQSQRNQKQTEGDRWEKRKVKPDPANEISQCLILSMGINFLCFQ